MIKAVVGRVLVAVALTVSIPGGAAAQASDASPEGTDWHLTKYAMNGELASVPWPVDATLLLQDGAASGSSGCNSFNGSYELSSDSIAFGEAFAMTQKACAEPHSTVEAGYMSNLPDVATWATEADALRLSDAGGSVILEFESAVSALTASDIAAIAAQFGAQQAAIERLDQRLDNVRIGTLRDRIKELETEVKRLRSAQAAASASSSSGNSASGAAYSPGEKTLLRGIPASIRQTCSSLRGNNLPSGTVAAVQCDPRPNVVDAMAYYLMEYPDALATMKRVMRANNVPTGYDCYRGKPGYTGVQSLIPFQVEGCFVDSGKANVRFFDTATECHRLKVGGTTMKQPMIYVAVTGKTQKIAPIVQWVRTPSEDTYSQYDVIRTIPYGNQPANGCP